MTRTLLALAALTLSSAAFAGRGDVDVSRVDGDRGTAVNPDGDSDWVVVDWAPVNWGVLGLDADGANPTQGYCSVADWHADMVSRAYTDNMDIAPLDPLTGQIAGPWTASSSCTVWQDGFISCPILPAHEGWWAFRCTADVAPNEIDIDLDNNHAYDVFFVDWGY